MNNEHHNMHVVHSANYKKSYAVLALIISSILLSSFYLSSGELMDLMRVFMGLFFVVFGTFKILGLEKFATTYAEYDLIAQRLKGYGYIYPFIELGLGMAYLLSFQLILTNLLAFVLMTIGSIGIVKAKTGDKKIMCACLGSIVELPLTTISLLEDVLMGLMALASLLYLIV
jgi:hypothetical protein